MTQLKTRRSPERQQFLRDILTTACEGGINYWCFLEDYGIWVNPEAESSLDLVQKHDPRLRLFDFAGAGLPEDSESFWTDQHWKDVAERDGWEALPTQHRHELNVEVIARGLRRVWDDGYNRPGSYWEQTRRADRTNGREGDYDSDSADTIVQYGVFGKLMYG